MAEKKTSKEEKSHSIYGGFRATIPHLIIENDGCDYSKKEINEMYKYINDKHNPISKKREESIADIHIDRVFKRKCIRGVEEFLKVEFQINSCVVSNEIPCKKFKDNDKDDKTNNNIIANNNESCNTTDSSITCNDK